MHFAFAIFLRCSTAWWLNIGPRFKLWQGVAFGIVLDILFHVIIMPAMELCPPRGTSLLGSTSLSSLAHPLDLWSIELVRRDLRNRITGEPDAEYPVTAR